MSGDLKQEGGTARALEWCELLEQRGLTNSDGALLEYFRANAWDNRRRERHRGTAAAWAWEQPELEEQILHLRRAVNHLGFNEFNPFRRCQVLTNLANQLNTFGRFVESLEYWERALAINQNFGKALGNRGSGLERYAAALYDAGHQALFCCFAYEALTTAVSPQAEYQDSDSDTAKESYEATRARIATVVDLAHVAAIDLDGHDIGTSATERRYRSWSLQNRLFLNPLNDLGEYSIAGRDVLMLPSFITSIDEPPTLIGFFNQMKQEFVSARWLFYEGVHARNIHFSDRGVLLFSTLDYPSYGLAVEKIKAAFRISYKIQITRIFPALSGF